MKTTLICIITITVLLLAACHQRQPFLTTKKIEAINKEVNAAIKQGDLSVLEQYLIADTEIYIDLDPDPTTGVKKIDYSEFKKLAQLSISMLDNMDIEEEIISIDLDDSNDQATLKVKAKVRTTMLGMIISEESTSTTVFGVIDNEIKILKISDELITLKTEQITE
ncbi:MAG: hypothetical protein R3E90_00950 [Marinicella sp.]|nr:hypothetical protein [Xanthomonadales bacterium]